MNKWSGCNVFFFLKFFNPKCCFGYITHFPCAPFGLYMHPSPREAIYWLILVNMTLNFIFGAHYIRGMIHLCKEIYIILYYNYYIIYINIFFPYCLWFFVFMIKRKSVPEALLTCLFLFWIHDRGHVLFHWTKCVCNTLIKMHTFERENTKQKTTHNIVKGNPHFVFLWFRINALVRTVMY